MVHIIMDILRCSMGPGGSLFIKAIPITAFGIKFIIIPSITLLFRCKE
ncbi:hypothetical protein LIT38_12550 [Bacillus sp. CMF12]|nr:hypothetical protein [Bacillus sp. CMF12]USK52218.1 hypothetical protein LIT38_12550 [Bacillus sp. CMF12]